MRREICYANGMSSPKVGSPMLGCEYNRVTFLDRSRVVAPAVVDTVTKVCNDHEVVTFMLAEECSAPASEASVSYTHLTLPTILLV